MPLYTLKKSLNHKIPHQSFLFIYQTLVLLNFLYKFHFEPFKYFLWTLQKFWTIPFRTEGNWALQIFSLTTKKPGNVFRKGKGAWDLEIRLFQDSEEVPTFSSPSGQNLIANRKNVYIYFFLHKYSFKEK